MIRDTTALPPAPKINATRLKSKIPTSNQTSAPIITKANAIIVVIFIVFPQNSVCAEIFLLYRVYRFFFRNYSESLDDK